MRIVYILLFLAALGWLVFSWHKKSDLKIPIAAAAGALILNIFPAISYLLLLGASGWAAFTFYKKRDVKEIKIPAIAVAAAFVLVLAIPSGPLSGTAGGSNFTNVSGTTGDGHRSGGGQLQPQEIAIFQTSRKLRPILRLA